MAPWLMNLRDVLPRAAEYSEQVAGFSARRTLPKWRWNVFRDRRGLALPGLSHLRRMVGAQVMPGHGDATSPVREVVLFADTFNRYFERENIDAALAVLDAGGYQVHFAKPIDGSSRPLCCGRTFLSVGAVDEARHEVGRTLAALAPFISRGVPVVGLEPSCLLGFRDEVPAMVKDESARQLADCAFTFEEFLAREVGAGRLNLPLKKMAARALVHGHCHQKAFDAFDAVGSVLRLVPGLKVEPIESSCCGMAGSFGYHADTIDVSLAMGELTLLPAVRKADADALIVADGTSCRHQIKDGAGRSALHSARVLAMALPAP
jgi:Fe-S oxidoreductase